tara:strand:- start:590 stop:1414 length:825 start_codon:yes stop_codon:yes gene_type:complete
MRLKINHWISIGVGIFLNIIGILIFNELFKFLFIISLFVIILPFVISLIKKQKIQKEKEEKFLEFSRDLVETVRSGTPISKSIINLKKRNYGALSPHVNKLANQLYLGMTLETAFETFAEDTQSKVISRAVGLISEAEKAGGKIESILESVAKSIDQIETLRKERKASISNLVTQGYIIFIVFIIIMLVLEFRILPLVSDLAIPRGLSVEVGGGGVNVEDFSTPLFTLLLVQSLFAGLVIGKISEGKIKSGIKHSFILISLALIITFGARIFFG